MKKLTILLVLIAIAKIGFTQGTTASATPAATDYATFTWTDQVHDFGKIKQGVPASYTFNFKNTGKVALVIVSVQPSCGCTTPEWSRQPVQPGQEGFIKATYNAAGSGPFEKTVTVTANIETGTVVLRIKGEVTPPAQ
jgi:Protein of unknown function (DUF1573)